MWTLNSVHSTTHDANLGFDEERIARLSPKESGYARLEEIQCRVLCGRLPRLQSINSIGARIHEREVLAPFYWLCFWFVHSSVHFLRGTASERVPYESRAQVAKEVYRTSPCPNVSTCRRSCSVGGNFVGGKVCHLLPCAHTCHKLNINPWNFLIRAFFGHLWV